MGSLLCGVSLLSACTGTERGDGSVDDRDVSSCDPNLEAGCWDMSYSTLYCLVESARDGVEVGSIGAADLPAWADLDLKDERPVIVDLANEEYGTFLERTDELRTSFLSARELDQDEVGRCRESLTQEKVRRAFGDRRLPPG